MVRTQIQLTDGQARALKEMARRRKVSMATLVREGVDAVVRRGGAADDDLRRRAKEAAGKFDLGPRDLSVNHDRYLAEAYRR